MIIQYDFACVIYINFDIKEAAQFSITIFYSMEHIHAQVAMKDKIDVIRCTKVKVKKKNPTKDLASVLMGLVCDS